MKPAPISYGQALKSIYNELPNQDMTAEYKAPRRTRHSSMLLFRRIESKWVFRWKVNGAEEVIRAKPRLVSVGYQRELRLNVQSNASVSLGKAHPGDRYPIRPGLANTFDAQQAFVKSDLNEEVYMKFLPVCGSACGATLSLPRASYGLKQPPGQCNPSCFD